MDPDSLVEAYEQAKQDAIDAALDVTNDGNRFVADPTEENRHRWVGTLEAGIVAQQRVADRYLDTAVLAMEADVEPRILRAMSTSHEQWLANIRPYEQMLADLRLLTLPRPENS